MPQISVGKSLRLTKSITFELSGVEMRSIFTSGGGAQRRNELERFVKFLVHHVSARPVGPKGDFHELQLQSEYDPVQYDK